MFDIIKQIWTGYEGNSAKYMPEGVRVDNYFTRPFKSICCMHDLVTLLLGNVTKTMDQSIVIVCDYGPVYSRRV